MKTKKNIPAEVEKTLNSLNDWKPIVTDAFFYTRVTARMENRSQYTVLNWLFDSPMLRPALIAITLTINILSINYIVSNYELFQTQSTDFVSLFTDEYQLDQSTESYIVLNDE